MEIIEIHDNSQTEFRKKQKQMYHSVYKVVPHS